MYSQVIVLFAAFCSSLTILALVVGKRKNPGSISLMLFGFSLFILALTYAVILINESRAEGTWQALYQVSILLACSALLSFSIHYSQPRVWVPRLHTLVLAFLPALILGLAWFLITGGSLEIGVLRDQPGSFLELLSTVFCIVLLLFAVLILVQMLANTSLLYKYQYGLPILGLLFPVVSAGLSIFGIRSLLGVRLTFLVDPILRIDPVQPYQEVADLAV